MALRPSVSREALATIVADSNSYVAVVRALGYSGGSTGSMVKRWIEHYGLSTEHFGGTGSHSGRSSNFRHTEEELAVAVRDSRSISDVCRALGRSTTGGTSTHLRRVIDRLGLDTSHFMTRSEFSRLGSPRRKGADELLVLLPEQANRTNAATLRRALLEAGLAECCRKCDLGPEWNGEPLTLQINHINGNRLDNRRGNLEFLCPNCHAQEPTSRRRGKIRA